MRPGFLTAVILGLSLLGLPSCGGGGGGATKVAPSPASGIPQNLRAEANYDGTILVSWQAPSGGADAYDLQTQVAKGSFSTINQAPIPDSGRAVTFTVDPAALGAQELIEIGFQVQAYKGSTTTGVSPVLTIKAPLLRPWLTLTTAEDGILRLAWTNNSKVADHLVVERFHSFDLNLIVWVSTLMPALPVGTTSFVDETPPEGALVYYTVRYSKGDESIASDSNRCGAAFRPPSNLAFTVSGQQVALSWTNHSASATSVAVLRSAGLTPSTVGYDIVTLPAGATSWTDTVPAPGMYTYHLESRGALWSSHPSAAALVVTLPPANGLALTSSLQEMPVARQAVRGDSGAWYFAQELHDGHPELFLPEGVGWNATTPPGATRLVAPYLALDPQERPHTVFLQSAPGDSPQVIMHGWFENGAWQTEEIARRAINTSFPPGIAWVLDTSGSPHLLWAVGDYTLPQQLEYAKKAQNGTWAIEPVTMPPADQYYHASTFQFFVDDSGAPHVLGRTNSVDHVVRTGSGTWTWEDLHIGQGWFTALEDQTGFGQDPENFTLLLIRGTSAGSELCLLSKAAGAWQTAIPVCPLDNSVNLKWARSRAGDRMAFCIYNGLKLVVGSNASWTTYMLDPAPYSGLFPAIDPAGRFHLLCQAAQVSQGYQVMSLNVLYDEVPAPPSAPSR